MADEEGEKEKAETLPADLPSALRRVLQANNPFHILDLSPPRLNENTGTPKWNISEGDIRKQFYKVSKDTHPDKNSAHTSYAESAFARVKEAHMQLTDEISREEAVTDYGEMLEAQARQKNKAQEVKLEPFPRKEGDLEEQLSREVERQKREAELREQKVANFRQKVVGKVEERLKESRKKKKRKTEQEEEGAGLTEEERTRIREQAKKKLLQKKAKAGKHRRAIF
eukprot:g39224.t1